MTAYNTHRIARVNPYRIATRRIVDSMSEQADRLRRARIDAGYASAQQAADAFGWTPAAYRHHENGTRSLTPDVAARYGRALKVNPGWLLALDAMKTPSVEEKTELVVEGAVAAGVWREQSQWLEDDRYTIKVDPSPVAGAERFAVRMEGLSMDKTVPPGSDLECLRVAFGFVEPHVGDLVIVERIAHDLTEMTCKRLAEENGQWVLRCESTRPEFQEPIVLGKPNVDDHIDNGINVVGIVIRAHQRHFNRN